MSSCEEVECMWFVELFSSLRSNKTFRIKIATKNDFGLLYRRRRLQADDLIISASFDGKSFWKGIENVFDNKFQWMIFSSYIVAVKHHLF